MWIALQKLGVPESVVDLVKSYHENVKARVRVDGELLDEIEVTNSLETKMHNNLYTGVVSERWLDKIEPLDGVSTSVVNKQDGLLFWRSTSNAQETMLYKGEFADDVVLLARPREAACAAIKGYVDVASSFGLTVSFPKTNGHWSCYVCMRMISNPYGLIEWVDCFPYLGSVIADEGNIDAEVDKRMANASRAFGALRHSVFFCEYHLSIDTKRHVYQARVLSILLYGSECWTPLRHHLRRLGGFHHRCIRMALTKKWQWRSA